MLPEVGQVVEVRRRRWIVTDLRASTLESSNHLAHLSAVDDEGARDEIQVVWELEPGARLLERAGLPEPRGIDAAERLETFLDAMRWGMATNADRGMLQAPFRSGASIEDYQLDPVVRALDMSRVNLLIADDVGLGKTIEAGLVIQELLLRHRARTVWVVCPASLQIKWQTEMREKFGLEFRIVDAEYLRELRRTRGLDANPWTSFPRLVISMDWMKSGEAMRRLEDALPTRATYPRFFDILVVDEAHNIAPSGGGKYAVDSQRTRLIRMLTPHFEHKLFLTATPHNGYARSFASLLELLDDQRFSRSVAPDPAQLQRVMVRRLKSDLVDADGHSLYPKRELLALEVDYGEEREIHRLLAEYTRSREESSRNSPLEYAAKFIHILLKKRLFSSPRAFANTLAVHCRSLSEERQPDQSLLDERILHKAIARVEEEETEGEAESTTEEANTLASKALPPLTPQQTALLAQLTTWAERAKNRNDAKADAILKWLEEHLRPNGVWNDRRVIIFTEYRDTLSWLVERLQEYGGPRLALLHGSLKPDEREAVKAEFQADPSISPLRILLATDAASEGIDLQNHCNYLIHVEIPWNPNVMEQRNGRIDRYGQRESSVMIWHPVGKGFDPATATSREGDLEYLMRAALKVETIRQDLGSVGPVIAQQIQEAMLGKRTNLDTRDAERRAEASRGTLAVERRLRERTRELRDKLEGARLDYNLSADRIARAVSLALELEHREPLKPSSLEGIPEGSVFEVPFYEGMWGRSTEGLEHPYTKARRPITFDHAVAKGRDDVVLAHLEHELVRTSLRRLRAELWSPEDKKRLHRVTVRSLPDDVLPGPVVTVWSRLLVTGGDHRRLHEELTLVGGELGRERFTRIPRVTQTREWMDGSRPASISEALFQALAERFTRYEDAILATVEARSRDRLRDLRGTLERRERKELEDIGGVLDDLERLLRRELEQPQELQPALFSAPEREQLQRDHRALEQRLKRIPEERQLELDVVRRRHADPTDRTFPVAVVFLVPDSLLTGRV